MSSQSQFKTVAPILLLAAALLAAPDGIVSRAKAQRPARSGDAPNIADGVSINTPKAYAGYTLAAPMNSTSTYLIDMDGRIVREWKSEFTPALSAYLLEDGHLLRTGADRSGGFGGAGAGGRIQKFTFDGELVWDFSFSTDRYHPHHDICPMPNGNVLMIVSDLKTAEEAIAAGRRPEMVRGEFRPDCILEVHPTGKTTGDIVWEWHAWDHLIQDSDKNKPNYGDVSEHPELIDINYGSNRMAAMLNDPDQLARLRSLGYVGGGGPRPGADAARDADGPAPRGPDDDQAGQPDDRGPGRSPGRGMQGDWMHTNSVAYNADLDQILLSIHEFNEVWIIDHGTNNSEAAMHTGGRRGRGGDLLYRWGNPQAYRTGTNVDQRLFGQHNAQWIPNGLPGAGHMLVFNNGNGRPDGSYSSVDEVVLPLTEDGLYAREEYLAYAPELAEWSYAAPDKSSFFSMLISGAQRLPNGNTLICSGNAGIVFEVTPDKEIVWQYKHPGGGSGAFGRGGRPGELVPSFVQDMLQMTDAQKQTLEKLQEEVRGKLDSLLTEAQRKQLEQPPGPPFGGFGGGFGGFGPRDRRDDGPDADRPQRGARPNGPQGAGGRPDDRGDARGRGGRPGFPMGRPGEIVPATVVESLNLSDEQSAELAELQKYADAEIAKLWTDDQRAQVEQMEQTFGRGPGGRPPGGGGGFGPPDFGPRGAGRRGGGFRGGPGGGGPGGGGPGGGGPGGLFRTYRYGADYAGLVGKDLTPGEKLSEALSRERRGSRPGETGTDLSGPEAQP